MSAPENVIAPGNVSISALLLVVGGAFVVGAGVEASSDHWVLLIAGGATLFAGHLAATRPILAGSHRGNGTLPSVAVAIVALAVMAGWAQARYGLSDARIWIVAVLAITLLAVAPWLAALEVTKAKLPALLKFESAAATELALLGIATWIAARAVTEELNDESSWRLFTVAGALAAAVFALPLAGRRPVPWRRSRRPATQAPAPQPAPQQPGPAGERIQVWITIVVRLLAAALAAGAAYLLWLEYRGGDGLIPILVAAGIALLLAMFGDRITKLVLKGGPSPEVTVELFSGGTTARAERKQGAPQGPAVVVPDADSLSQADLSGALEHSLDADDIIKPRRLVRAKPNAHPLILVGEAGELEKARANGQLDRFAWMVADKDGATEDELSQEPARVRITGPVDEIGTAIRAAMNALKSEDS